MLWPCRGRKSNRLYAILAQFVYHCDMRYFAILRPGSAICRLWRAQGKISGVLEHVPFFLRGGQFESDELSAERVELLSVRQACDIDIAAFGVLPDGPSSLDVSEDEDGEDKNKTDEGKARPRQRL